MANWGYVAIDKTGKEKFATRYNITSNYNAGVAIGYYSDNYMQPKTLAGLDKGGKELWTVENVKEGESREATTMFERLLPIFVLLS